MAAVTDFQPGLEALEGRADFRVIPHAVDPLQAQTEFERRARIEDYIAHAIALIMSSGFFLLAFAVLLGFVNISNAAVATMVGTILGYAIGKIDPVMTRYFHARGVKLAENATGGTSNGK